VFVDVQMERRDGKPSPAKELLRNSQISPARFIRQQYWAVYEIPGHATVYYDSKTKQYDIKSDGDVLRKVGDADSLLDWVSEKSKSITIMD